MHVIELTIKKFLQDIKNKPYKIPEKLLFKFAEETRDALKKQFEREPSKFTLRMSNIGKPLCQLQMEKQATKEGLVSGGIDQIKAILGDLVEDLTLFLLHASGIKVTAELLPVNLNIADTTIKGTLDVILNINDEDKVYDIKSCSEFAFKKYQRQSFEEFVTFDNFGYCDQLFGYATAANVKPGGFIFVNKSSGELYVLIVPEEHEKFKQQSLKNIINRIEHVNDEFKRSFTDFAEIFKKKPTGNRILGTACVFCDYKHSCWKDIQILPQIPSNSKTAKLMYYTYVEKQNV